MRTSALVAILAHAAIFAMLLVTLKRKVEPPEEVPPSPVAMVFESGRKEGPTAPNPTPEVKPVTPAPTPKGETPQAPASPPTPPAPEAPPQPQPRPETPPPPGPKAETPPAPSVPETPAQQPQEQPRPATETPVTPAPQAPPPPPVTPNPEVPLPPPPPPAPPAPAPRPPPSREAARPRPPSGSSGFPAPLDYSFGSARPETPSSARTRSTRRTMGSIDMSLGPTIRGILNSTPKGDEDGGPDYRNLLSQWVAEHAYYPEEARRMGEQGDSVVHVEADHFGHVKEVQLIGRSGSIWLDAALTALFRDRTIPPLPTPGNDPIEFNFTMRYILRRPPGY